MDRFELGYLALFIGSLALLFAPERSRARSALEQAMTWLPALALALFVWGNIPYLALDPALGDGSLQEARLCVLFVIALTLAQSISGLRAPDGASGVLVWPSVAVAEFLKIAFLDNPGNIESLHWRELLLTIAGAMILVAVAHEAFDGFSSRGGSKAAHGPAEQIAGLFSCFAAVVLFWGRGEHFLPGFDLDFYKVVRNYAGEYQILTQAGRRAAEYVTIRGAGAVLTLALVTAAVHGTLTLVRVSSDRWMDTAKLGRGLKRLFAAELVFLAVLAGLLIRAQFAVPGFQWLSEPFRVAILLAVPATALPVCLVWLAERRLIESAGHIGDRHRSIAIQMTRISVILISLSLLAGAWTEYRLSGAYWGWSLRETVSLLIWLAASLYLHLRNERHGAEKSRARQ